MRSPHVVHLGVVSQVWLWFLLAFGALGVFGCLKGAVVREEVDSLLDRGCGTGAIQRIEGKIFLCHQ
jgi:hypothetical protein